MRQVQKAQGCSQSWLTSVRMVGNTPLQEMPILGMAQPEVACKWKLLLWWVSRWQTTHSRRWSRIWACVRWTSAPPSLLTSQVSRPPLRTNSEALLDTPASVGARLLQFQMLILPGSVHKGVLCAPRPHPGRPTWLQACAQRSSCLPALLCKPMLGIPQKARLASTVLQQAPLVSCPRQDPEERHGHPACLRLYM